MVLFTSGYHHIVQDGTDLSTCIQPFHSSVWGRLRSIGPRPALLLVIQATRVRMQNRKARTSLLYDCAQLRCSTSSCDCASLGHAMVSSCQVIW